MFQNVGVIKNGKLFYASFFCKVTHKDANRIYSQLHQFPQGIDLPKVLYREFLLKVCF